MSQVVDYPMLEREYRSLSQLVSYVQVATLPEIWAIAAQQFGDRVALHAPHLKPEVRLSYRDLHGQITQFATGLQALGVQAGDRISLFSDNSPRWLVADQGMMLAGAVNAVRSSQADPDELLYLLTHSGSTALAVENLETLATLRDRLSAVSLQFIVLLSDETPPTDAPCKVLNFQQLMELAQGQTLQPVPRTRDDLATLIYTSGTTGRPKGAMLTHGNLLHQVTTLGSVVEPHPGDRILSILPTWHAYERSAEYFLLSQGCTQVYTSLRTIKKDLQTYKPNYMVSVPRIWESIYEGVQKQFREQPDSKQKLIRFFLKQSQTFIESRRLVQNLDLLHRNPSLPERLVAALKMGLTWPLHTLGEAIVYKKVRQAVTGGDFRFAISGGGSLAKHIDDFFEIVGVGVLVGYGLTETAPVTNARRPWRNLRGASGQPIPGTEIRIVHPETRQPLPPRERGLVLIRGPQVMPGYYNNPEATQKAIDADGWFNSGDLGWVTEQNDLVLTGRAKDTIVLTNGENIEPQPIEDACLRSEYVDQIMLVGQDQKMLGALIVPHLEALEQWAIAQGRTLQVPDHPDWQPTGSAAGPAIALDDPALETLFREELTRQVKSRPGYGPDDRIGPFRLILEPFSMENGLLTQTLKVRRNVVMDRYQSLIDEMFAR